MLDPGILDAGSRILDPESRIQDPGSGFVTVPNFTGGGRVPLGVPHAGHVGPNAGIPPLVVVVAWGFTPLIVFRKPSIYMYDICIC